MRVTLRSAGHAVDQLEVCLLLAAAYIAWCAGGVSQTWMRVLQIEHLSGLLLSGALCTCCYCACCMQESDCKAYMLCMCDVL
jgi:hypothetical protein